jgi:hypothetical protein
MRCLLRGVGAFCPCLIPASAFIILWPRDREVEHAPAGQRGARLLPGRQPAGPLRFLVVTYPFKVADPRPRPVLTLQLREGVMFECSICVAVLMLVIVAGVGVLGLIH